MELTKEQFIRDFKNQLHEDFMIKAKDATTDEHFVALAHLLKNYASNEWIKRRHDLKKDQEKTAYYFSIEFLPGRMLETNLLNMGILDLVQEALEELNINFDDLAASENDMALGNGGLGRLAAAFMDSLATISAPGFGNGIRYKYGLFKQKIVDGYQVELPDAWLGKDGNVWEIKKPHSAVNVRIYGDAFLYPNDDGSYDVLYKNHRNLRAVPYDIPQIGFQNGIVNNLRLWDVEIPEEDELRYPTIESRRQVEDITNILYPDDTSYEGKSLRLIQEYFMVSAGLQTIVENYLKMGLPLKDIHQKVAVHINDTHPALAVPEFMRILMDEYRLNWEDAWHATVNTMSYTNHTILSEALEKWETNLFLGILPRIYQIVSEIDNRYISEVSKKFDCQVVENTRIIKNDQIHMANLAIIGGHSINGVAKLHTELLIDDVLKNFYQVYPEKFNNKTNGIVVRRWSQIANPLMSEKIDQLIGSDWRKDIHQIQNLENFIDQKEVLEDFYTVKRDNKKRLADYIENTQGIKVNPDAIFDVQVKRLHAYKRQLLNLLHIIKLYWDLKDNPDLDMTPRVFIFGAKAAPGYKFAKAVIKLINEVANLVNNDSEIKDKIKVVFLENYNVTLAELIIPAADVSEQISTAGKEASGTSNMKFMMNGAITLATLDGANIEIKDAVGDDNIVIFGMNTEEVYKHYENHDYNSRAIYENNPVIRRVVDSFINGSIPNSEREGQEIYDALILNNDEYFLLGDFESYVKAQEYIDQIYRDKYLWTKKAMHNIAKSDRFSSDDTIRLYADEIWKIKHN
ncbi:glycogen/starch/alpha-glucan phosphorylase [Streptococcaceae bacterium ESL0687]|nr:glycogen/starch/alpha-glucan phosphorylase [Streptococcaceae bacterium ESL0687]